MDKKLREQALNKIKSDDSFPSRERIKANMEFVALQSRNHELHLKCAEQEKQIHELQSVIAAEAEARKVAREQLDRTRDLLFEKEKMLRTVRQLNDVLRTVVGV